MIQLQFDSQFTKITAEAIPFWRSFQELPNDIVTNLRNQIKLILFEKASGKFYCSDCLEKLDATFTCPKCKEKFHKPKPIDYLTVDSMADIRHFRTEVGVYLFQVVHEEIIIYQIFDNIYYDNPLMVQPYKTHSFKIEGVYHVTKVGLENFLTNEKMTFKELDAALNLESEADYPIEFGNLITPGYVYVANLDSLKATIYRYTYLWQIKDYLTKVPVSLFSLTYSALHWSPFEYLIKKRLASLAFSDLSMLTYDNEARQLLKENSDYLTFIRDNNFNAYEFLILKWLKIKDLAIINFYAAYFNMTELLLTNYALNLEKLYDWFQKEHLTNKNIRDYFDYLHFADMLGYNLKDHQVLYPEAFWQHHDEIFRKYDQMQLAKRAQVAEKIKKISQKLKVNQYEDDKYIIYPAPSLEALIEEGKNQNNCVRTYAEAYANDLTHIYFLRLKKASQKSFVTIEEKNGQILQARIKNNAEPTPEVLNIINNWIHNLNKKTINPNTLN